MKTIQIRNVPNEVHRELRMRAAGAGISLSDYALAELERLASRPPISDVLLRASNRPGGISAEQIVAAIHEGRSGR